jgi:hypothetical protein
MGGGVAAYLASLAVIRWWPRLGSPWGRVVLAILALPTGLLG